MKVPTHNIMRIASSIQGENNFFDFVLICFKFYFKLYSAGISQFTTISQFLSNNGCTTLKITSSNDAISINAWKKFQILYFI